MPSGVAVAGQERRILCPSCNGFLIRITTEQARFDVNCGRSRCGDLVTVTISGDSVTVSAEKKVKRA